MNWGSDGAASRSCCLGAPLTTDPGSTSVETPTAPLKTDLEREAEGPLFDPLESSVDDAQRLHEGPAIDRGVPQRVVRRVTEIKHIRPKRGRKPLGQLELAIHTDIGVEHRRPKQDVGPAGAEPPAGWSGEWATVIPLADVTELFRRAWAIGGLADEGRVQPGGCSRRSEWESGTVVDHGTELPAAGYRGRDPALRPSLGLSERAFCTN